LIDTSTVLAVYLLARRFLSSRGGLIAAVCVAANPFLIYFSALILSETLFTALLAWGMYGLVRQDRTGLAGGVGHILLALAVLVRPSAMALPIVLALAAVWPAPWRQIILNIAVAGGCVLIVLSPWAWRNAHHPEVRAWVWTTTNGGVTTYDGFHEGATGASDQKAFIESFRPLLSRMDELERDSWLSEKAHEWIQAHPGESLRLMIVKIGRTWSPVPLSSEYGGRWIYLVAGVGFGVPFFLLILLGLWKGALPRPAKVFLLLPAIYFTGIHALSVGSLRYRIPVEPPMAVLAGSGALALSTLHGPSRRKS
jgi:4-amino-4-deoxy-L-arabinose transferase-like glycosyltransferase